MIAYIFIPVGSAPTSLHDAIVITWITKAVPENKQAIQGLILSAQERCSLRFHVKTFSPIWVKARLHIICSLQEKLLQLLNHLKCIKICFGSWQ